MVLLIVSLVSTWLGSHWARIDLPVPAVPAPHRGESALGDVRCSVKVAGEDLARIVQTLSVLTRTNLVLLSSSDAKLTLNLTDVRLSEMLRHICALNDLAFLQVGDTFVIAEASKLRVAYPKEWAAVHGVIEPAAVDPVVTRSVATRWISAGSAAETLTKLFGSDKLSAQAAPMQAVPSVTPQSTSGTTGTETSVLGKDDQAAGLGRTIVLRGPESLVRQAIATLSDMDKPRPLVTIDVTIHDISDSALRELGLNWAFGSVEITETNPRGINFGSFSRAPQTFSATIKALEKADKANLLASPNISVLDGERAFILIGDRINFPVLVGYSQNNAPIFSREEERVGIYLQVAASVSEDKITLSVYPQVSTVTGFLEVNGASYPQISTREAQTTLSISSGETWILGGLMKSEEVSQMEKVPLVSEIPIIGELFKRRKRVKSSSQVIITLKPTVSGAS